MRIFSKVSLVAAASAAALIGAGAIPAAASAPQHHRVIFVHPGKGTISAAVAKAKPGDKLVLGRGTFFDSVTIPFTLTIHGQGWSHTVVRPPQRADTPCGPDGFCAIGVVDAQGNPDFNRPVRNVTIENLRVTGFEATGVDGFNTKGYQVRLVRADHNGGYGIARFASTKSVFEKNRTSYNGEAGLYMGDSPNGNSIMRNNVADHNGFGLFLRDSTRLAAVHNTVFANCVGILALNSGEGAPFDVPAGDYLIARNTVTANNMACPADEGPPTSGIGIALAGVHNTLVIGNKVTFNRPTGPSLASGGVVLVSTKADGGADPSFNKVVRNKILHNSPVDVFSDGTGRGNVVKKNICQTSDPRGLCPSHIKH